MSLKIAILGLLKTFGAMSGYDIKHRYVESVGYIWESDLSQIYRTLDRLESDEMVVSQPDPDSNRGRKIYQITPTGVQELQTWLLQDFELERMRNPAMLQVFLGKNIPPERFRAQIETYRKSFVDLDTTYDATDQMLTQLIEQGWEDAFFQRLTLQLGRRYTEMTIEWCNDVLRQLDEKSNSESIEPTED